MEQHLTLSPCERVMILRRRIEEAFTRGDLAAALALSRYMDDIQLRRWEALAVQVS